MIRAYEKNLENQKINSTIDRSLTIKARIKLFLKYRKKFEKEFRNSLGVTIADFYRISVNRLSNKRKLNKLIQYFNLLTSL